MRALAFGAVIVVVCAVAVAQEGPAADAEKAEVERLVNQGNAAYGSGDYQAAVELYGLAADIDPWHLDAGNRQILALLRSAIELGDRGAAFDNAVAAFEYVKSGVLPDDLTREVETIQELLDNLPEEEVAEPAPEAPDTVVAADTGGEAAGGPGEGQAGAAAAAERPARAEPEVTAPILISQVLPEYPNKAQRLGIEGDVRVRLLVGVDGAVKEIEIDEVPRMGLGFEKAVSTAVRRWRFRPATEDGRPVSAWVPIRIPFERR